MNTTEPAAKLQLSPTEQIRALLAPYLAKVQALADSRPDLDPNETVFEARLSATYGLSFTAVLFHSGDGLCAAHQCKDPDDSIARITSRLAEIPEPPAPPTREQLIAQKEAELAALKGGQS